MLRSAIVYRAVLCAVVAAGCSNETPPRRHPASSAEGREVGAVSGIPAEAAARARKRLVSEFSGASDEGTPSRGKLSTRDLVGFAWKKSTEAMFRHDHRTAAEYCELALALDPHNPSLHTKLGGEYERMKNHARAAAMYREALRLDANAVDAMIGLADVALEAGDAETEASSLARAIRYRPRSRYDAMFKEVCLLGYYAKKGPEGRVRRQLEVALRYTKEHTNLKRWLLSDAVFERYRASEWFRKAVDRIP